MRPSMQGCLLSAFFILLAIAPGAQAADPVRLIFDTDIGNDIDDALALGLIQALESRSEVQLLAVTITKDNVGAAPYVDLGNQFYGHPHFPIGVVHNGKTPQDSPYLREPAQLKKKDGSYVYPH